MIRPAGAAKLLLALADGFLRFASIGSQLEHEARSFDRAAGFFFALTHRQRLPGILPNIDPPNKLPDPLSSFIRTLDRLEFSGRFRRAFTPRNHCAIGCNSFVTVVAFAADRRDLLSPAWRRRSCAVGHCRRRGARVDPGPLLPSETCDTKCGSAGQPLRRFPPLSRSTARRRPTRAPFEGNAGRPTSSSRWSSALTASPMRKGQHLRGSCLMEWLSFQLEIGQNTAGTRWF